MTDKVAEVERKIRQIMDRGITASAPKPVQFRNKNTGEVATQIPLYDIANWEKTGHKYPKPKKPNPATAKFSEMIQYQIDLQKWRQSN